MSFSSAGDDMIITEVRRPSSRRSGLQLSRSTSSIVRSLSSPLSKLCVVLDLDGVLVSSSTSASGFYDFDIYVNMENGSEQRLFIQKRPYLDSFLATVGSIADIIIFTRSKREWVEQVISYIDPLSKYFTKQVYADQIRGEDNEKSLSCISPRTERTICIECTPQFKSNSENRITISKFDGVGSDGELLYLKEKIEQLNLLYDVRNALRVPIQ